MAAVLDVNVDDVEATFVTSARVRARALATPRLDVVTRVFVVDSEKANAILEAIRNLSVASLTARLRIPVLHVDPPELVLRRFEAPSPPPPSPPRPPDMPPATPPHSPAIDVGAPVPVFSGAAVLLGTPLACCIALCYVRRRRTSKDRKLKAADTIPLSASRSLPASIYCYPSPSPPQQQHLYYQRHHPQHHLQQAYQEQQQRHLPPPQQKWSTPYRQHPYACSPSPPVYCQQQQHLQQRPYPPPVHYTSAQHSAPQLTFSHHSPPQPPHSNPRFSSPFSYPPPLYRSTDPEHPRPPAHMDPSFASPAYCFSPQPAYPQPPYACQGAMSAWDTHSSAGGDGNTWIAGGHHQQATAPSKPIKLVDSGNGECRAAWSASQGQAGSPLRRTTRRRTTTTVTEEEETEYVRTSSVDEDLLDDKAVDKQHYARHYLKSSPAADDGKHRRHDRGRTSAPGRRWDGSSAQRHARGQRAQRQHHGRMLASGATTATNVQARLPAAVAVMSAPERERWEHQLRLRQRQQQGWEDDALEALEPGSVARLRGANSSSCCGEVLNDSEPRRRARSDTGRRGNGDVPQNTHQYV